MELADEIGTNIRLLGRGVGAEERTLELGLEVSHSFSTLGSIFFILTQFF